MAGENRNGAITVDFADGPHIFRLGMAELEELQEKTSVGPFVLLQRLIKNEWRLVDVREAIRLGLIGGGMGAIAALSLVKRYVIERPDWYQNAALAQIIVGAAILGAPEEAPGKEPAPEAVNEALSSQTGASPSESFTPPLEQPA